MPGIYCANADFNLSLASGYAIEISADNVTVDLNGHRISNLAAGPGTAAYGILTSGARQNITVRNGTLRGFFWAVVLAEPGSGHLVEDLRADFNTNGGLAVSGTGSIVRRNQIIATGGSARGIGIEVNAPAGEVSDNDVIDTIGPFSYGIHITRADGAVIERNRVSNSTLTADTSFGIIVPFAQNVSVVGNRIANCSYGVVYSSGGTGKYRDNLTSGVTTPFSGTGTDAGNNN